MSSFSAMLASANPLEHVVRHPIPGLTFELFGRRIVVDNHMLMALVAAILMLVIFPAIARRLKRSPVPRGMASLFESMCVFIREEVARPALGARADAFLPYLWTTFFFILFCNLLGLVPLGGLVYLLTGKKDIGGTPTGNIWITGALAAVAFVMIHISGMREQGVVRYWKNFIPPVPWPLIPVMYVLEFIGAIVKPCALAIRLFANMLAGHTVLGALLMMIAIASKAGAVIVVGVSLATVIGCVALSLLELFVAFLQAYIFTILTALFIGAAVHPEH